MRFSIIIPVYNVEKQLEQCLNSVLSQTFTDYEVICVNDGSSDGSLMILNDFAEKDIRIKIIDKENGGLSDARNTGIKAAKGDYLFLLDSDDWIVENALEILNKNIENQDFIAFNGKRFFEDGRTEAPDEGISEQKIIGWEYYNKYALKSRKFHFVCTVLRLYRREFLLENELFFKKGIYHEDNLFTPVCCYYAKNVKVIPDVLYIYRIREGSITQQPNNHLKRIFDNVRICNILGHFFVPLAGIDKQIIYQVLCNGYFGSFGWIISIAKEEKEILDLYQKTDWNIFRAIIYKIDARILYYLLQEKKWKIYYKLFYFNFFVVRKMIRKFGYIKK